MPIPAGIIRVVFGGTLPGGEIWESGFWMTGSGVSSEAEADAQAEVIGALLASSDSSGVLRIYGVNVWGGTTSFNYVKVYAYTGGTTATYIGNYALPTPVVGGASGLAMPNQVALVVSMRTGLSGRRNRGRMYLPITQMSLEANGNIAASTTSLLANAWQTAFNDLNAGDAGTVVVLSQVGGTSHPLTGIAIDSRPDIIRKRANKQVIESVQTRTITS